MIHACRKCHQLYEGLESELLAATDALNEKVRHEIARGGFAKLWTIAPFVKRTEAAAQKARAL